MSRTSTFPAPALRTALFLLLAVLAAALVSCMDAEPAEISVNATTGGQPANCRVMLFDAAGSHQLQETYTENGVAYMKNVVPGTYVVKFKDGQGSMLAAIRKFTLRAGDSQVLQLDVSDASQNPKDVK